MCLATVLVEGCILQTLVKHIIGRFPAQQTKTSVRMNSSTLIFQDEIDFYDKNFRWLHRRFLKENLLTML